MTSFNPSLASSYTKPHIQIVGCNLHLFCPIPHLSSFLPEEPLALSEPLAWGGHLGASWSLLCVQHRTLGVCQECPAMFPLGLQLSVAGAAGEGALSLVLSH